jgi:protease-4
MSKYMNYKVLALDILRGKWLISAPEAERLLPVANSFLDKAPLGLDVKVDEILIQFFSLDNERIVAGDDNEPVSEPAIVIIPIHGTLTKYGSCFTTSTLEIADLLDEYRVDENIIGFILDIDSPGGSVNAIMPLIEAIRRVQNDGKPIISHCDFAASAAYWIASHTDSVVMDNPLSEVGSIGVCCQIIDDREDKSTGERRLTIYAPESPDKNKAYRDALDGNFDQIHKELSEIAVAFQEAIKASRPNIKNKEPGVLTGATFTTTRAIELGMADSQGDIASCAQNILMRSHNFE